MQAGRELDALIAEKIFGCKVRRQFDMLFCECGDNRHTDYSNDGCQVFEYSTDIAAAWTVVDKFRVEGKALRITPTDDGWECENSNDEGLPLPGWGYLDAPFVLEKGETAPHAICLAALKAVRHG